MRLAAKAFHHESMHSLSKSHPREKLVDIWSATRRLTSLAPNLPILPHLLHTTYLRPASHTGKMPHNQTLLALLLVLLACLSPVSGVRTVSGHGHTSGIRTKTYPPTAAPMTVHCNMTDYRSASGGTESCTICRNNHLCAWCLPNSGGPGYCFNNVEEECTEGSSFSFSDSICKETPFDTAHAIIAFSIFCALAGCCCCGCCWYRRRRHLVALNGADTTNYSSQLPTYRGQQQNFPPQQQYQAHTYIVQQASAKNGTARSPVYSPADLNYNEKKWSAGLA